MKVLVCLLCLLSLTSSQETISFNLLKQGFDFSIAHLKSAIRESMLSEDGLSLGEGVSLEALEALCDPTENAVVGRKCRKELSKLGDCSATPCKMLDWVKNEAPASLNRFLEAKTYEGIYQVIFGEGIVPVWRMLCECPGFVTASINCVKNYDGTLFEREGADRSEYDEIVNKMDWKALRSVVHGVLKSGCGEVGGANCLEEMTEHQASIGNVLDNTFSGDTGCLSLRRAEEEVMAIFMSLVHESTAENVKAYIAACVKLWDTLMCDDKCAGEMQETFYSSCCIKRAVDQITSKTMKKNFTKLFKSIWNMVYEGEGAAPKGVVDQYLSMFNPATFCEDKTSVYRDFNQQCEAIEA